MEDLTVGGGQIGRIIVSSSNKEVLSMACFQFVKSFLFHVQN